MIAVILQARLSSHRLPAKVLLPVGGLPLVVLSARRAGNTGLAVTVATSTDPSDDVLEKELLRCGIKTLRGPLDDVLSRFAMAIRELSDDAMVVRLTADNALPDGAFIEELVRSCRLTNRSYLGTDSPADGLPYGLSAEVFTVAALREAATLARATSDREHVTPYIRRRFPGGLFRPQGLRQDLSHLRCTVDTMDDYIRITRLFSEYADPVLAPWVELCDRLEKATAKPQFPRRMIGNRIASEFVLGSAQLGLPGYGRTNETGRPAASEAVDLVREAVSHGVSCFDTARAYGTAERILGKALEPFGQRVYVVTKLDPLSAIAEGTPTRGVAAAVDASVLRSCRELGISSLSVVLLHRWQHRRSHNGIIWSRLLELRSEGLIDRLGASVSSPAEAAEAITDPDIVHLQIPFNLVDHRWRKAGFAGLAAERQDVIIHARSVLLQGILAASVDAWPRIAGVCPELWVRQIDNLFRRLGRVNRLDLCLSYVRAQPWIHGLVIGVERMTQLRNLLELFQRPPLAQIDIEEIEKWQPDAPEALVNPALWPVN